MNIYSLILENIMQCPNTIGQFHQYRSSWTFQRAVVVIDKIMMRIVEVGEFLSCQVFNDSVTIAIASIEILLLYVLMILPRSVIDGIVGTARKEATAVRRRMTCQERRALDFLDGLRGCCHTREDGAA